ncbi:serine/threonine protein kinase [Mycobacterium sp. MYCO198283]|uniref:serine/threonine-protein kinase n=1 Tax=Mycobacterium sp. MYCO198283 TaxID=2883505 RepID=UPI001E657480|nr:serine/threonine-protein kinase [Mycobacterium sp. MYCO198283]MCG5431460.1 serine/threonine protein kinase [Mycobacterium sp. MYCO198283]
MQLLGGRYELRGALGSGGMAQVCDGWDRRLHRPVAVKLLHPALTAQQDARRRFCDEARSAAALNHPNIVAVHDYGEHDGTPYIVMERLPGESLADRIAAGPLRPEVVRSVLDDVLAALAAAHAAGVLHRDIKPGNILFTGDGDRVKLADFGIAKTAGAALTATGQLVGTIAYLSPERLNGAPASVADDLYAVGVTAYEALVGERAYPFDHPGTLARAITAGPPPPLASRRRDVDPQLAAVVDRALATDPRQRFADARQLRAAFAGAPVSPPAARPATKVMTSLPIPPPAPLAPPRRPRRSTRTKVLLAAAAAVAFVVSALALALDAPSTTPHTVSTSSAPPPTTTPTPTPTPPTPTSQAPTVAPVVEQPVPAAPGSGKGKGKGNEGNGKGPRKGD